MAGKGEEKGYQEDYLSGEGEEYGFAGFADRLKESGGNHLKSYYPESEHGERECPGSYGDEGCIGSEGACDVG